MYEGQTPRRRRPRTRRTGLVRRLATVALVATVISAYSGGVSYAHWTVSLYSPGSAGTGALDFEHSDPFGDFEFECTVRTFPKHAISFIRIWIGESSLKSINAGGKGTLQ